MKKRLFKALALLTLFSLCTPAFAANDAPKEVEQAYTIIVNGETLALDDLPVAPYLEGDSIMVPLRKIGEALGYTVGWDAESGAISIDDDYIQKATLFHGTATVIFEGKLKVINMSREIENAVQTVVHNGYTYVPLEFFQAFFNDTTLDGTTITIEPSKSELHTNLES